MDRKVWIRRGISLLLAIFCLAFGITWDNRFCLGDVILNAVGLPAWSQGTTGLHYPAIPAIAGTLLFFYLFYQPYYSPNIFFKKDFLCIGQAPCSIKASL